MTDRAPGQGAERAAAADVVTCNDVPPQGSGRGGGGQEEQGAANGVSPPGALAWTGERRVKKPKKKKLLAEAMAKAAATTAGVDASTTTAAVSPTSTSCSAQLAASVYGEGARASVELRRERAIRLEDVQNLVLWVLGEGSSPRWAFVKNKALIDRVLLVSVPGLGESLWGPVKKEGGEKEKGDGGGDGDVAAAAAAAAASPAPSPSSSISRARALLPSLAVLGEPLSCIARTPDLRPAQAMDLLFSVPKAATPEQLQRHAKRKREEGGESNGSGSGRGGSTGGGSGTDFGSGAAVAARTSSSVREEGAAEAPLPAAAAVAAAADGNAKTPTSPSSPPQQPHHHHHHQRPPPRAPFHPPHLPPPHHYTLTREVMVAREYPLPHVTPDGAVLCPPGFVSTRPRKKREEKGRKEAAEEEEGEQGKGDYGAAVAATTTTPPPEPPSSSPPHLVAIDCEMCETEQGFELARVSAVAPDGSVLLDELVRPARRVLNYHTRFSGITAEKLAGVETTLERAREMLLELVHAETVLVGHALENDLRALRLLHSRVVDTGVLYPHPAGPPYRTALRNLSYKFLRRTIQEGDHDSVDDARAAMDLALLKFSRGPAFGATPMAGAGGIGGVYQRGERLLKVLSDAGKRSTLVDRPEFVNRHVSGRASGIPAGTDGERASRAAREVASGGGGRGGGGGGSTTSVNLVWTQLTGLARLQQARADAKRALVVKYAEAAEAAEKEEGAAAKKPPLPPLFDGCENNGGENGSTSDGDNDEKRNNETFDDPFELDTTLRQIDAHLNTLITAAPANTLVVIVTCHGDTAETRRLQEQAWRRAQGLDHLPRWSLQAETHLASVRSAGMRGLCFCGVKQ